jgi:ABC-type antimicrobial peptide transport system permease subunit
VVGVASDVRQTYEDADRSDFYKPKTPDGRFGTFYVRTARPTPAVFDDLRNAAAEIDRDAVVNQPRLVSDDDHALAGIRFLTYLLIGFAAIAAFLAMLGIYGVTAYAVQQRHKEVAIRRALGASEPAVVRMFLRGGALLLAYGTVAGLIGGATISWLLAAQVVGVQPLDVPTYVAACALLLGAGFATLFWAARRATATDVMGALNAG